MVSSGWVYKGMRTIPMVDVVGCEEVESDGEQALEIDSTSTSPLFSVRLENYGGI